MRAALSIALAAAALTLTGCTASRLHGSWVSASESGASQFQFASATFAADGTYTADIRYGDHAVANTGAWEAEGDELTVSGEFNGQAFEREYVLEFQDADHMSLTGEGRTVAMKRFKP